jgi:uncharacterized membrane protein (DUF485 family)
MRELGTYVAAGVVYIAIGVLVPAFVLSWVVAAAYLLVAVWLVPAAFRRLAR